VGQAVSIEFVVDAEMRFWRGARRGLGLVGGGVWVGVGRAVVLDRVRAGRKGW